MAVEPCWHFDAAYSGGSALGQSFAFVDRSSSGGSAPIPAVRAVMTGPPESIDPKRPFPRR